METAVSPLICRMRVVNLLRHSGAMTASSVADSLQLSVDAVQSYLEELVARGKIEALRPVGTSSSESDYYRWIRASDYAHRWQVRVLPQPQLSRYKDDKRMVFLMDQQAS